MTPYTIVDSHCHLDAEQYDADRAEVIARAAEAGVTAVLIPGTDMASSRKAVALLDAASEPALYASVGVHPHEAKEHAADPDAVVAALRALASDPRVLAIGETGLDYYYNFSPPEAQQASLRAHVRLARELERPLVVHCRDAEEDLLRILREEDAAACGGVVHCFTGTRPAAEALLAMGFHLGFTGVVTFKKSEALRDIVKYVPISRVLLETDGPYLAPVPHRGKRNEPAWLPRVAEVVAEQHGLTAEALAQRARENTVRLFRMPKG
ncbi:MAG: TatD family deoxyribonuclease [Armatimonadetes bacterium]|nr:TatD family deoxyribonuclease [Armatimonadota bacterium]